ncbi:MAG: mocA [Schlesneria sp.]|nr:mocA [Schlesneria sp.]
MRPLGQMFAVIPAVTSSLLMERSKLLLPLAGATVVDRILSTLEHPAVTNRYVVVNHTDIALQSEVTRHTGTLVVSDGDPADMRASVSLALDAIQREFAPSDDDGWLLAPAEYPALDGSLIEELMHCWHQAEPAILVPRFGARRGHPTLFRWKFAREVARIPVGRGLNWLLREYASDVTEVIVDNDSAIAVLETDEDYAGMQAKWEESLAR